MIPKIDSIAAVENRRKYQRSTIEEERNNGAVFKVAEFQVPCLQIKIKRLMDFAGALIGLIILMPVFLVISILVKLSSPGSIFFSQPRIGRDGKLFKMYKFRTMLKDSESKKNELFALNEQTGPVFKIKNDPRITAFGKFLRKYSLDELPQLVNVLFGEMSLVGPRPAIPAEVEKYKIWQTRRLTVTPGLTCIWQVSGRSNVKFEEWMRMDLQYIDQWNLWLDVNLLFRTVKTILTADGAY